jgi:hypothetical protein
MCYVYSAHSEDRATLESDLSAEAVERRRGRPSLACPFYPVDALPRSRSMRMLVLAEKKTMPSGLWVLIHRYTTCLAIFDEACIHASAANLQLIP